jgi:hypothetical protein
MCFLTDILFKQDMSGLNSVIKDIMPRDHKDETHSFAQNTALALREQASEFQWRMLFFLAIQCPSIERFPQGG